MAKIRIEKEIDKCWNCPMYKSERVYTPDSFEMSFNYICNVANRVVAKNVEHEWEMPPVPDWCPLLVKESEEV